MTVATQNKEQMDWVKWMGDNLMVETKEPGPLVPFVPNDIQCTIFGTMFRQWRAGYPVRIIILKARQEGASTAVQGLFYAITHLRPNTKAMVSAHDAVGAQTVFAKAKCFHNNLPEGVARETEYNNRAEVQWSDPHRSLFKVQVAGPNLGRGGTFQLFHASELAFWEGDTVAFQSAIDTMPKNVCATAVVIESTANGDSGEFYRRWALASKHHDKYPEDMNCFIPIFFSWMDNPEYAMEIPSIRALGPLDEEEQVLVDDHGASPEQLWWRRYIIEQEYAGDVVKFHQNYPSCVAGDTRVSTAKGLIPIRKITQDELDGTPYLTGYYPKTEAPVHRLTTTKGYSLKATADHPILRPDGSFTDCSALAPDDMIVLQAPQLAEDYYTVVWHPMPPITSTIRIDEEWGRFLGYFMGDGCLYKNSVYFACNGDKDVRDDIKALMEKLIGRTPAERENGRKNGNSYEIRSGSCGLRDIFEILGCTQLNKSRGRMRRVCVPECIWRSPQSVVREFLRGLFEADGFNGYKYPRVVFCSKYLDFVQDVQLLLLCFGVTSRISSRMATNGSGRQYAANDLILRGEESRAFNERIGFVSERKSARISRWGRKQKNPKYPLVLEDTVQSVEECGFEQVFDITVEPTHVFSANGIAVHNSPTEAFISTGSHAIENRIRREHHRTAKPPKMYARLEWLGADHTQVYLDECDFDPDGCWRIWMEPETIHEYAVGGDVSEGIPCDPANPRSDTDRSTALVLKRRTLTTAALYVGRPNPDEFGVEMLKAGWFFHEAWICPEVNNAGQSTLDTIRQAGYGNLYRRHRDPADLKQVERNLLGWRTTGSNRDRLIDSYLAACRPDSDWFNVGFRNSFKCLSEELALEEDTFIRKKTGKREHRDQYFDDILFAAMLAMEVHRECPMSSAWEMGNITTTTGRLGPEFVGGYPHKSDGGGTMQLLETT